MSNQSQGTSVPSIFTFESHEVRSLLIDDQPWFVATDVARALNYRDAEVASRHLDADEKRVHLLGVPLSAKGVISNDTLFNEQHMTIINESGLYALVLRSRKPEARKFAKWVTSEVLPAIRKTGGFQAEPRGDIAEPDYYRECRAEVWKFMDSLPKGMRWPSDEAVRQRIADGYLADILMSRRWLMSFDHNGKLQTTPVGKNVSLIDPNDPVSLWTLIYEYVPIELIPKVIATANERVLACYNISLKRLNDKKGA